jgi:hypothetical protein
MSQTLRVPDMEDGMVQAERYQILVLGSGAGGKLLA